MSGNAGGTPASELYQVRGSDPLVIAGTAATVIVVAVLACGIPAWRASRLDPMAALRRANDQATSETTSGVG